MVVGVQSPKPAIHILAATGDYAHLHTIPASSISTASPTFALSGSRLLAYASSEPPAHLQSPHTPPVSYPPSNPFTPLPSPGGTPSTNFTAGLSIVGSTVLTGAMRLGTGVLEGVKMGITAAGYGPDDPARSEERGTTSRSAPPVHSSPLASRGHARRASAQIRSAISGGPGGSSSPAGDAGEWVTVLDLQPLLGHSADDMAPQPRLPISPSSSFLATSPPLTHLSLPLDNTRNPEIVVEFPYVKSGKAESQPPSRASPSKFYGLPSTSRLQTSLSASAPSKAVSSLAWSPDGSKLAIGGADGGSVRVFAVPRSRRVQDVEEKARTTRRVGDAVLVYELMRGVTPALIKDVHWSADGLWNGFVSANGTLRRSWLYLSAFF